MKQSEFREQVKALKEEVKPSETRYTPSGHTPSASIAMLIPLSLLVAFVCYGITRFICTIFWDVIANTGIGGSFNGARFVGVIMIVINLVIFFIIAIVTRISFKYVAYLTKLRNPKVGQWFSFFSVLAVCLALYLPLYHGHSIAPTDIAILFIPLRWILMFIGALVLPLIVSLLVAETLRDMKFCEETGHFLEKITEIHLPWDNGKQFLKALKDKDYSRLLQFASFQKNLEVPYMIFRLFGHPKAEVAFVDVEAKYEAKIGRKNNKSTTTWLVYHDKLTKGDARTINGSLPEEKQIGWL